MSERAVLLSVAPEFAEKIADGTKTVELRRRFPDVPVGTWIFLYVTLPVGAILGRVKVAEVHMDEPITLWKHYHECVGLSRARFDKYFEGRDIGYAVLLADYQEVPSQDLDSLRQIIDGFVAPQSYRFLDEIIQHAILSE